MPEIDRDPSGYPTNLAVAWETMNAAKGDVEQRCEQYALWTVPSVCPEDGQKDTETRKGNVAIGARLVNSLANRVVDVMFPSDRPFFSLPLSPKARRELIAEFDGDTEAAGKQELAIRQTTEGVVDDAMRILDLTQYRPVAVEAVKHAIVTGGCVMRRHQDDMRSVYGIKDYAIYRDTRGVMTSVILRDVKTYSSLTKEHQDALNSISPNKYKQDAEVKLYSYFERQNADKWIGVQGLDDVVIDASKDTYTNTTLPVLDIAWTVSRGDNYPRGLVEDNAVLFHNIDVVTLAELDMIGILADVKFLVDPSSMIDLDEINAAPRGSYHPGRKEDINPVEFKHRAELQTLDSIIDKWERQLAQVFLLMSATTRDAERVTAEEIRSQARELESAFGGLYSKLALSWQKKEAEYLVYSMRLADGALRDLDVTVTTGMESLSREGQMDSLRIAIADLQMLDTVPEDIRAALDSRAFAEFVFTNRGVSYKQILKTQEQVQADQEAAMAQQQQLMQMQSQNDVAAQTAIDTAKQG